MFYWGNCMLYRIIFALLVTSFGLAGCQTTKQPSPEMIAKLQGGKTKVVIYGFCVPMDHLVKTTLMRATMTYVVNGKKIGAMKTCSYKTFSVPSGYWESHFSTNPLVAVGSSLPAMVFKPGQTQYLYMRPAGYGTFEGVWVSKAQADKGIADIKKIGQVF